MFLVHFMTLSLDSFVCVYMFVLVVSRRLLSLN